MKTEQRHHWTARHVPEGAPPNVRCDKCGAKKLFGKDVVNPPCQGRPVVTSDPGNSVNHVFRGASAAFVAPEFGPVAGLDNPPVPPKPPLSEDEQKRAQVARNAAKRERKTGHAFASHAPAISGRQRRIQARYSRLASGGKPVRVKPTVKPVIPQPRTDYRGRPLNHAGEMARRRRQRLGRWHPDVTRAA